MEIKLSLFVFICILLLKYYPVKDNRLETVKYMMCLMSDSTESSNLEKHIHSLAYIEIYTKDGPQDIFEVNEFWRHDVFHKITSSFYENVHIGNEIIYMDVWIFHSNMGNHIKTQISFKFNYNKIESINIYFYSKDDMNIVLDTSTLFTMDDINKKHNIKVIMI